MPQLDKVTFFSQFFWLSVFFITFYIGMYKAFLPRLSRILKLRQKKMSVSNQLTGTGNITSQGDALLSEGLSLSRSTLQQNFQQTQAWVNQGASIQPNYKKTGYGYVQSIGEISLSQNLAIHQSSAQVADKVYAALVFACLKKISV